MPGISCLNEETKPAILILSQDAPECSAVTGKRERALSLNSESRPGYSVTFAFKKAAPLSEARLEWSCNYAVPQDEKQFETPVSSS